jgi:hypothetical protein
MIEVLKRTFPFPVAYVRAERSFPWESIPSSLAKKRVFSARPTSLSIELPYAYDVMAQARFLALWVQQSQSYRRESVTRQIGLPLLWIREFLFHNVKQRVRKFVLYSGIWKCHDYDMNCSRREHNACIVWTKCSYSSFAYILQQKIPSHGLSRRYESYFFMLSIQT